MNDSAAARFVTADIPGVGGVLKDAPEDFLVDELPAREPSGEGEHLHLLIEKRGATTSRAIEWLSRRFRTPRRAFGYAGMKDRHAITRQWISIHDPDGAIGESDAESARADWLQVLEAARDDDRIRVGQLRGNRFRIRIRGAGIASAVRAHTILQTLAREGAPNFFGAQRYGSRGNNHRIGRAIIRGDYDEALELLLGLSEPGDAQRADAAARRLFGAGQYAAAADAFPRSATAERKTLMALEQGVGARAALESVSHVERNFWLSGFQAAIFDDVLGARLRDEALGSLIEGDIAYEHDGGAMFEVTSKHFDERLRERVKLQEICPTGPLWGMAMTRAAGAVDAAEVTALERSGVTLTMLESFSEDWNERGMGARRPLRMRIEDPAVEAGVDERGEYIECAFSLPAGSFATVVMNEVMKSPCEDHRLW